MKSTVSERVLVRGVEKTVRPLLRPRAERRGVPSAPARRPASELAPHHGGGHRDAGRSDQDGEQWTGVADRDYQRRNFARLLVAHWRLPATLPARSAVVERTVPVLAGGASIRLRTKAATLPPLWRASCSRSRIASGSLMAAPSVLLTTSSKLSLTEPQHRETRTA